jgi:hypothetical protein
MLFGIEDWDRSKARNALRTLEYIVREEAGMPLPE